MCIHSSRRRPAAASRRRAFRIGLWVILGASACGAPSPAAPSIALNERFTLSPGHAVSVAGELIVAFVGVPEDSRCPADALCIQAGDASVDVRVQASGRAAQSVRLSVVDREASTAVVFPYRIELLELSPYPFGLQPIRPAEYRATFRVSGLR